MRFLLATALIFALCGQVAGSGERAVVVDSVSLRSKHQKVRVDLSSDKEGRVRVEVHFGENAQSIPPAELRKLFDPDLASVRLLTSTIDGGPVPPKAASQFLIVSFDYGAEDVHKDGKGEEIWVRARARLIFEGGKYVRRETCIPAGNLKNDWKFFLKKNGEKEIPNGSEKGIVNPYDH